VYSNLGRHVTKSPVGLEEKCPVGKVSVSLFLLAFLSEICYHFQHCMEYVLNLDCVNAITIGMTSQAEVLENLSLVDKVKK